MAHFVLVHGSFHGPWCWAKLSLRLQRNGHSVIVPDLADAGPSPDLHSYAHLVAQAIAATDQPVILVGHSMGGLVITQAAELVPERIASLVYVSGLLLRHGETLQSFLAAHADLNVDDLVLKNMQVSPDGATAAFPAAAAPQIFYNRCTPEDAAWAAAQLRPQPTAVYATPLAITPEKFGAIPRAYALCLDDQAVPLPYQTQMLANTPCATTWQLRADHSPFLSDIDGLLTCLQQVAA